MHKILDNNIFLDLKVIEDLKLHNDVHFKLNRCITSFGTSNLSFQLNKFYNKDNDKIAEFVNTFYNDHGRRAQMTLLLHKIKKLEEPYKNWIYDLCDQDMYLNSSYTDNYIVLTAYNRVRFSSILITLIMYIIMYFVLKYWNIHTSPTLYLKQMFDGYSMMAGLLFGIFLDEYYVDLLSKGTAGLYCGFQVYSLYSHIRDCISHYYKCEEFTKQYNKIVRMLEIVDDIIDLDSYDIVDKDRYKQNKNKLSEYFNRDYSIGWQVYSKIHYDEYAQCMNDIMLQMGKIDMWLSILTLIDEGYVIPTYDMNSDKPYIKAKHLWNPLLENNQIKNDLSIGDNKERTTIITGPNKGGKSTYMKTSMLAIVLSQSLCITCAEGLIHTPFVSLYTYMNIPDVLGRESLFEAELNRCYDLYKNLLMLKDKEFIFGVIDELFTGTNPLEGASGSYAVIKKITTILGALTIISTHFHNICDLKKVNYYKFSAKITETETIFDYKLKYGVSNQCIALHLLREKGYDKEIVDEALKKLKLTKQK